MGLFNNNKDCFTVTLPFYGIFDYSQLEVVDGPKIYSTTEGIKYTYKVKFKKLQYSTIEINIMNDDFFFYNDIEDDIIEDTEEFDYI